MFKVRSELTVIVHQMITWGWGDKKVCQIHRPPCQAASDFICVQIRVSGWCHQFPDPLHPPSTCTSCFHTPRDVSSTCDPRGVGEHSDHWGSTCPVPVSTWGHYQVSSSPETREICTRRIPSPSVLHTVLANILLPFTAGCKVFLAKWEERRRGFCSNKKRFWLWLGPVLSPLTRNSLS